LQVYFSGTTFAMQNQSVKKMELLNKTKNGQLLYCKCCNTYQLEFGNLFFSLQEKEFMSFRRYIAGINGEQSAEANRNKSFHRKIFIHLSAKNLFFCLHLHELEELKTLLLPGGEAPANCSELLIPTNISIN
jgi:hypothetical protein